MLFETVLDESIIDNVTASSFNSIIKAIESDKRLKKIETKISKALQFIKGYYSYLSKGSGRFAHINGNEMSMLVGYVHMYLDFAMDYDKAEKGYNEIISKSRKRLLK